jgi:hypothetical protein
MQESLNEKLANAVFEWRGLADKLKHEANMWRQSMMSEYDQRRADDLDQEAARWNERARVASEGYVLHDPSSPQWCLGKYAGLIAEAARCHRLRFVEMPQAHSLQPGPVEPGTKPAMGLIPG